MTRPTVLIVEEHAAWYASELARQRPEFDYVAAKTWREAMAGAEEAEVLVGLAPFLPPELLAAMPRLEWIQALTTGVDNLLRSDALRPGTAITPCGGFHGPQMSELALMLMLACVRRLPRMLDNQRSARWERWEQPLLRDKTVCIVGLGRIAEYLAGVCGALGMRVTGVSDSRSAAPGVARVYGRADLPSAAGEADFLVVLVPYSERTHHIIDAGVLNAMKPTGILVNIARGGCVDEDALLDALRVRRIAGAALDVFAAEPLPQTSPFWSEPNVILTPHIGGYADVYREQALPIVADNLAVYARGGKAALTTRVDPEAPA